MLRNRRDAKIPSRPDTIEIDRRLASIVSQPTWNTLVRRYRYMYTRLKESTRGHDRSILLSRTLPDDTSPVGLASLRVVPSIEEVVDRAWPINSVTRKRPSENIRHLCGIFRNRARERETEINLNLRLLFAFKARVWYSNGYVCLVYFILKFISYVYYKAR